MRVAGSNLRSSHEHTSFMREVEEQNSTLPRLPGEEERDLWSITLEHA